MLLFQIYIQKRIIIKSNCKFLLQFLFMHVTKKYPLRYHAWYNYPQISSQDYEVLAAQMQLFFYTFAKKENLVQISLEHPAGSRKS